MDVSINNLFARAVVEKKVCGSIFVNEIECPETFYVIHPYGMSLLFGKSDNYEFNKLFREHALNTKKQRTKFEWMQAFPGTWDIVLKKLFEGNSIQSIANMSKIESGIIEIPPCQF